MSDTRKSHPADVSDEEWSFVTPYLVLLPLDAGQRRHDLREVFNALRWIVRAWWGKSTLGGVNGTDSPRCLFPLQSLEHRPRNLDR